MTDATQAFPFTIGPNTSPSDPVILDCFLGWADVESILLVFPAGCSGLVGVSIQYADNPVYPIGSDTWYVLDDYVLSITVTNQQQGGQWQIVGYNNDIYQHTVSVYYSFNYLTATQQAAASTLVSL